MEILRATRAWVRRRVHASPLARIDRPKPAVDRALGLEITQLVVVPERIGQLLELLRRDCPPSELQTMGSDGDPIVTSQDLHDGRGNYWM